MHITPMTTTRPTGRGLRLTFGFAFTRTLTLPAILTMALMLGATGCQSSNPAPKARTFEATAIDRNQGYALLYTLVQKNQEIDKLLILKSTTPESAELVKAIATLCRDVVAKLDDFAKGDATLGMDRHGLPVFEEQTRMAIEATTTRRLLLSSGDTFEVRLLQTQSQSMDYLAHLALQLAERDNIPTRATYLREVSQQANDLFNQVMERLTITKPAPQED